MSTRETLGERISAVEASFNAHNEYAHERWHKLNNDLQPLMQLPSRMERDIGRLQGTVDGRINSVEKSLERSLITAIEKALAPVQAEMSELRIDVDKLKEQNATLTGARLLFIFLVQTLIAASTALLGAFEFSRGLHG